MAILKRPDDCNLNKNVICKTSSNLSEDIIVCFTDFSQLETDINHSLGISILKLEAFKLVKWFIEINKEQRVPKDLLEYIEQEQALELLKG